MKIFENLSNRKKNYYNSNETTGPNSTKTSYISNTTNSTINYSNINNTNNNFNNDIKFLINKVIDIENILTKKQEIETKKHIEIN